MAQPTAYLETTVIGHLVGRMHPDPVIAGRQTVTRVWWQSARQEFRLLVSQLVAEECASGDSEAAIPSTEPRDALHISIAAANGVQFLVTWNFRHIANAAMRDLIEKVCRDSGFEPPTICTPDELCGGSDGT